MSARPIFTDATRESWSAWRAHVVDVIHADYGDVFDDIDETGIDWEAWRPLYEQGCSARMAVGQAFGMAEESKEEGERG